MVVEVGCGVVLLSEVCQFHHLWWRGAPHSRPSRVETAKPTEGEGFYLEDLPQEVADFL